MKPAPAGAMLENGRDVYENGVISPLHRRENALGHGYRMHQSSEKAGIAVAVERINVHLEVLSKRFVVAARRC
jgi:hypothetical protein